MERYVAAGSQALRKKSKRPIPSTITDGRSGEEKFRLLVEAARLSDSELGEFLRREGLHEGDLERFKAEAMGGLSGQVHSPTDQRRIQELERVNATQEKRLREADLLLELPKKSKSFGGQRTTQALRAEVLSLLDDVVPRLVQVGRHLGTGSAPPLELRDPRAIRRDSSSPKRSAALASRRYRRFCTRTAGTAAWQPTL
jgi:hypothetical protein